MTPNIEAKLVTSQPYGDYWAANAVIQQTALFSGSGRYVDVAASVPEMIDGYLVSWSIQQSMGDKGISFTMWVDAVKDGQTWRKLIGHGPNGTDADWYYLVTAPTQP